MRREVKMKIPALLSIAAVFAAVAGAETGVNLLNNPGFAPDGTGFPAEWCYRRGQMPEHVSAADGVLRIDPKSKALSFKQDDIHLVPGRRYRFGAEVRTSGGAEKARMVVFNYTWTKEGSLRLPADTGGAWKKIEHEFEAPESRDELYAFTVYCAAGATNSFSLRAPFLVPASGVIDGEERAPLFSGHVGAPVAVPPPPRTDGRRLNTMVRRLLECEVQSGDEREFSLSGEGWIWIALDGADGKVALDGADAGAFAVEAARVEAMRYAGKGVHRLKFEGFGGRRRLVVNAVPTIMVTSFPEPKYARTGRLAGEFLERYLYPAYNVFTYGWAPGNIPGAEWKKLAARGRMMFGHLCRWNKSVRGYVNRMEDPGHLAARFRGTFGMRDPRCAGFTFDEIAASSLLEKTNFTEALRLSRDLPRPVWVWSSGVKYEENPINSDYLSSIVSASGGRGRLLFECYAVTQRSEAEALAYLDGYLDGSLAAADRMVPGFARSSMIVHGAYTRVGRYCTDCFADVDTKRFWDLYFHRLATGAVFEGLAGIGLYAIANGEEEDLRWASRIIRHYALEGRTDRLSDAYGFRYEPGHIGNGDFGDGLAGWTAQPAQPGSVKAAEVKGLASLQSRRNREAGGDTACVFRRSALKPNVLRRKIVGLEAGRLYSLRYAVAPVAEVASRKGGQRTLTLKASVVGAEDVTASSPLAKWGEPERSAGVLNARTMVFKAAAGTAELVFTDWACEERPGAPAGEELALNFVRVVPYYAQ
jgi:hypothetical protein